MTVETARSDYQLISGVFTADEAKEILMTLIQDKINFHQRNELSRRERFGEPGAAAGKRIMELKKTRTDLAALLEKAGAASQQLVINCTIEVNMPLVPG